jgi:nitrogen fixation NifU-like protein
MSEVTAITQQDILDALGGLPEEVKHCALLAARTLKAACDDYLARAAGSPDQPTVRVQGADRE